jgi:hypothetical protein
MVFRCYSKIDEKILLDFSTCKNIGENISWKEWHNRKPLTVYYTGYTQLLLEYICEIYPIKDPTNSETMQSFDVCFDNWIGKDDWEKQ